MANRAVLQRLHRSKRLAGERRVRVSWLEAVTTTGGRRQTDLGLSAPLCLGWSGSIMVETGGGAEVQRRLTSINEEREQAGCERRGQDRDSVGCY